MLYVQNLNNCLSFVHHIEIRTTPLWIKNKTLGLQSLHVLSCMVYVYIIMEETKNIYTV